MSSPVEDDSSVNNKNKNDKKCAIADKKQTSSSSQHIPPFQSSPGNDANNDFTANEKLENITSHSKNKILTTNFPNVGSSPIAELFINSNSSSDDEENKQKVTSNQRKYNKTRGEINSSTSPNLYENLDGIIMMHNTSNKGSKIDRETLSDDDQIIVQLDQEDDEQKQR
jgi:hypothetical protein